MYSDNTRGHYSNNDDMMMRLQRSKHVVGTKVTDYYSVLTVQFLTLRTARFCKAVSLGVGLNGGKQLSSANCIKATPLQVTA